MGWLWTSSSAPKPSDSQQDARADSNPPSTGQTAAPNEPVDPEIQKFYDLFKNDDSSPSPNANPSESSNDQSKSTLASWLTLKASPKSSQAPPEAPIGDALSESLLPTDMSCRQAFDLAWSCNSLGGQFNAVYRYGEMRSCSEHWDDFWFCMRTKSYTGELKEKMVRAHYREKEWRRYGSGKPNSEDVWESRTVKVPPGTAFTERVDAPTLSDDEWRRAEDSRRKAVRAELGHDQAS
ncbi:6-phosphofructo-2-kinase 1 [Purpureocillium lavendulum]|uniref:6-phosphofructo-2-kinase 1 n=1 Tax=Purpureocillium lavendulum TaxID=1247861 RepID=A0AB34FKQ1_9HYPO|nr:6-phosphofructo-2-kinase 1 [Purpureocillium lavendulum]